MKVATNNLFIIILIIFVVFILFLRSPVYKYILGERPRDVEWRRSQRIYV